MEQMEGAKSTVREQKEEELVMGFQTQWMSFHGDRLQIEKTQSPRQTLPPTARLRYPQEEWMRFLLREQVNSE